MSPAQLTLQQLAVTHHLLQAAHAAVEFFVVGMQEFFPELVTQLTHLLLAVTQLRAQVIVAEHHPFAGNVVHIEGVGQGVDHVRPEVLALQQGQFDAFAAGDVVNAEGDGVVVLDQLR